MRKQVKKIVMLVMALTLCAVNSMDVGAWNNGCKPEENQPGTDLNGSNGGPTNGEFETDGTDKPNPDSGKQESSDAGKTNSGNSNQTNNGNGKDKEAKDRPFGPSVTPIDIICEPYTMLNKMSNPDLIILNQIENMNPGNKLCGISKGFITIIEGNTKTDIEKYTWTAWIKDNESDAADLSQGSGNYSGFGQDMIAVWMPYEKEIRAINNGKFPENRDYRYPVDTTEGKLSFWVHKAGYYDVLGDPLYRKIGLTGYQRFEYIVKDIRYETNAKICGTHTESSTWCNPSSSAKGQMADCHTTYSEVANYCDVTYFFRESQPIKVAEATVVENKYASEIGKMPILGMEVIGEGNTLEVCGQFADEILADAKDGSVFVYPGRDGDQWCIQTKGEYEYQYTDKGTNGTVNVYATLAIKDGLYKNMANGYACIPDEEDGSCIIEIDPEDPNTCIGDECEEGTTESELLPPSVEIEIDIEEGNPQKVAPQVKKFVHLNKNVRKRTGYNYYADKARRKAMDEGTFE